MLEMRDYLQLLVALYRPKWMIRVVALVVCVIKCRGAHGAFTRSVARGGRLNDGFTYLGHLALTRSASTGRQFPLRGTKRNGPFVFNRSTEQRVVDTMAVAFAPGAALRLLTSSVCPMQLERTQSTADIAKINIRDHCRQRGVWSSHGHHGASSGQPCPWPHATFPSFVHFNESFPNNYYPTNLENKLPAPRAENSLSLYTKFARGLQRATHPDISLLLAGEFPSLGGHPAFSIESRSQIDHSRAVPTAIRHMRNTVRPNLVKAPRTAQHKWPRDSKMIPYRTVEGCGRITGRKSPWDFIRRTTRSIGNAVGVTPPMRNGTRLTNSNIPSVFSVAHKAFPPLVRIVENAPVAVQYQEKATRVMFRASYIQALRNVDSSYYVGEIFVGGRSIDVIIDTGSFSLLVLPSGSTERRSLSKVHRALQEKGKLHNDGLDTSAETFHKLLEKKGVGEQRIRFASGEVTVMPGRAVVAVGPLSTTGPVALWQVGKHNIQPMLNGNVQGILGMGLPPRREPPSTQAKTKMVPSDHSSLRKRTRSYGVLFQSLIAPTPAHGPEEGVHSHLVVDAPSVGSLLAVSTTASTDTLDKTPAFSSLLSLPAIPEDEDADISLPVHLSAKKVGFATDGLPGGAGWLLWNVQQVKNHHRALFRRLYTVGKQHWAVKLTSVALIQQQNTTAVPLVLPNLCSSGCVYVLNLELRTVALASRVALHHFRAPTYPYTVAVNGVGMIAAAL
eukprot:GHVT01076769.1.p1 GENE.GHVT01076769.1~~GHVT01076769.1.p1  ORF type:complete len:730 (+),score=44.19 GHVT01076769.1:665-2854(+)